MLSIFNDESIWDDYAKTDGHAKGMKNKSYPLYREWCEIFGRACATDEHPQDFIAADRDQLEGEEAAADANEIAETNMDENEINLHLDESGKIPTQGKNKRKRAGVDGAGEAMVSLMGKFCKETSKNLQTIAHRIGYAVQMSEKRGRLSENLGALGFLTTDQQIISAKILAWVNKDLDLFFSMPKEAQACMVALMGSGRI